MVETDEARIEAPVRKIFVVIDPKRMIQPSLEKAEWVAERNHAHMHLYCCCYDSQCAFDQYAKQVTIERTRSWLDRIGVPAREKGIKVTTEVGWAPDWREAIVAAATESGADLIVKTASRHTPLARHMTKTVDWILLQSPCCPTLLVSPIESFADKVVLAAVKLKADDELYSALNEQVVIMAHRIARVLGADLHAVTAYKGEGVYFDRQKFADVCRLPRNRVHSAEGPPHRAIAEVAKRIGAGVLIIGCANAVQNGERSRVLGDTAQRVIDAVRSDIVVVPATAA